jgi:alpha-tubulin suppressor-like RCC1 family protein
VAVSCGDGVTLAVTCEGKVVGWGDNSYHQCSIPEDLVVGCFVILM